MRPVLILASERSGTNLLRMMLGMHSSIAAPPPPHLWLHLTNILPYLGPLDREANLGELVRTAIAMTRVEESHLSWKHEISEGEVLDRLRERNLSGVIGALYETYAARDGAEIWACKENNLFDHAHQILDVFPDGKCIYLSRDGRDYACSVKRAPTHDQHVYSIACEWKDEQCRCIRIHQDLLARGRSILVRYEELIEDAELKLRELCEFLEIAFESSMLEYHKTDEAKRQARKTDYWRNVSEPVLRNNKGKFLKELSTREIEIFESVAGGLLKILGYPLLNGKSHRPPGRWTRLRYKILNGIRRRLKQRTLWKETGRKERADMLREVYRVTDSGGKPLADPIEYG